MRKKSQQILNWAHLGANSRRNGSGSFWPRNREIRNNEQGAVWGRVSVEFSHACRAQAGCDLSFTARNALEDSSVEMAGGLSDRARGVLALAS
jgi:hypothetical protein